MSQSPELKSRASLNVTAGTNPTLFHSSTPSLSFIRKSSMSNIQILNKRTRGEITPEDIDIHVNKTDMAPEFFKDEPEFEEEESDDVVAKLYQNRMKTNLYKIYFKPKVFLKFLLMHVLFYYIMGPFVIILTPIFGYHVLYNQGFAGAARPVIAQSCDFLLMLGSLLVYYLVDHKGLQAMEVYMLLLASLIRIVIVASKYAYQSSCYLKMFHTTKMSVKDRNSDQLLGKWRLQNDEIIQEEIQSAILRLEIDSPFFFFNFLGPTSTELSAKLMKTSKLIREPSLMKSPSQIQKIDEKPISPGETQSLTLSQPDLAYETSTIFKAFSHFFDYKQLETRYLYGYNFAYDLMQNARKKRFASLGKVIVALAVIRGLIPTFYRVYLVTYKKEDIPVFTSLPYVVVPITVVNMYYFFMNSLILAQSVQAFRSKIWAFKQLGYIISPKIVHYFKEKKLYPTLNIFDPITLKTWANLRKVAKEFGKRYFLRNNMNITIAMLFYIFVFTTLIMQAFGVFSTYSDPLMLLVFGFETLCYFPIFVHVMTGAAYLNSLYKTHKNLLKRIKTIIGDFQKLSHLYVGPNAIKPDNIIYKQGLKLLKAELGEDNFQEKLVERATLLTQIIDEMIEDLEFEEENEPFQVMGININYTVLKSLLVALISLLFALGQYLADA